MSRHAPRPQPCLQSPVHQPTVITTGFGMIEICAGAIFNLGCPRSDPKRGRSIASVRHCMLGIELRIMGSATGRVAEPGEPGRLEIRGTVVFEGYYRDQLTQLMPLLLTVGFERATREL